MYFILALEELNGFSEMRTGWSESLVLRRVSAACSHTFSIRSQFVTVAQKYGGRDRGGRNHTDRPRGSA